MKIPAQVESTAKNLLIILVLAPSAGVGLAWLNGELHGWQDLWKALDHGMFNAVCMAFAWLVMASPLGKQFRALASEVKTSSDPVTGAETKVVSTVEITGPVPDKPASN